MDPRFLLTSGGLVLTVAVALSAQTRKDATAVDTADPVAAAIARGVGYLTKELPKWKAQHPCYSCHNNGDAARALLAAGA